MAIHRHLELERTVTLSVSEAPVLPSYETGEPVQAPTTPATPARSRARARDILLAVAGIAGALSLIWLIFSLVFGYSIIVFKTGSMAPTMPTGALAIERPIAPADIRVGDVVTVADPGQQLPVTHRVVSISRNPADGGARLLVLKGDANTIQDQFPYTVTAAHLVVGSVPVLGTVLVILRQPIFIGLLTLLIASLVLWAFWPTPAPRYRRTHRTTTRGDS